jgi:hypothetical protein
MYAKVGFNTIMYYNHTKESGSQPAIVSTYVRIDLSVEGTRAIVNMSVRTGTPTE